MLQTIHKVVEEFNEKLGNVIEDLPRVRANEIGLDSRAGSVFVDVENGLIIAKNHNVRSLEYYGGFEYIPDEYNEIVGDYKIYGFHEDHDRIANAVDYYEQHHDVEDEGDEE